MPLRFIGIDPDTKTADSPTVGVDQEKNELVLQGGKPDPGLEAECSAFEVPGHAVGIPDDEAVIRIPAAWCTGSSGRLCPSELRLTLDIFKRTDYRAAFVVLPRRGVVERTLSGYGVFYPAHRGDPSGPQFVRPSPRRFESAPAVTGPEGQVGPLQALSGSTIFTDRGRLETRRRS